MTNSTREAVEKEERRLIATQLSDDIPVSPIGTYTFEQGLDAAGVGLYQWLLLLYVGFAWICDAMEMMLLSFLAPAVRVIQGVLVWDVGCRLIVNGD